MKNLVKLLVVVLILLATAAPAWAGGDQNHGDIGQGSICRYENPFAGPSCPPVP
jgi:hypothetical protein